ncbi:nuclear transport factor 2 family protein [soil metagenome]
MNKIEFNRAIALNWIDAFNEHNLEKLLNLYAADAVHFSPKLKLRQPETNGQVSGRAVMDAWWTDAFDHLPSLKYQLQNLVADDQQVVMEYLRTVDGEANMMVAEILEIEDGHIIRSRVYHG